MQSFLKWLGKKLFGKNKKKPEELYRTGKRISPARPQPHSGQKSAPTRRRAVAARTADDTVPTDELVRKKDALIRNRFVREDTGTHETLRIFDDSVLDTEEDKADFDPYNTGRFDRSKHWDRRTRE